MKNVDVQNLNDQYVMAWIMGAVRAEHFCVKGDVELDISKIKNLTYDELRALYKNFLHGKNSTPNF